MAIRYKINRVKLGKKRLFGQDKTFVDFDFDTIFNHIEGEYFISKYSPIEVNLVTSGQAEKMLLSTLDGLLIGMTGRSFSGVDVRFNGEWIHLTMYQPANHADWYIMNLLLEIIHSKTGNPIFDEEDNIIALDFIKNTVDKQVEYGHNEILNFPGLDDDMTITLNGILTTIFLNKSILQKHSSPSALMAYLMECQWNDAYVAHPTVNTYQTPSKQQVLAYWTISSGLKTLFPLTPYIPPRFNLSLQNIHSAIELIGFFDTEVNKPIGFYQFRDVMSKVKSLNPHKVDDNNAIIEIDLSTMKKFASELEPVDISQIVKNILSQ
jgi:hypothetical protein